MTEPDKIGARLRSARRRLRLSQAAVATFIGTTRQTVAGFEHGTKRPDLEQLVSMANLYRLTLDELVARARSAVRAPVVPAFSPRFNVNEHLSDQDADELTSFERYLRQRPHARAVATFERKPFEPIAVTVERLCNELKITRDAPVPVYAMLGRFGVEVRFTALEQLAGALLSPASGPLGILINSDQPADRQRFSAAHELGHLVLGHTPRAAFISFLGRRFDPVEAHADQFAAELLIPSHLLARHLVDLRDGTEPTLPRKVYRLASTFMVSFQAMATRLEKLGMLSPNEIEELGKAKPGEIAKALGLRKRTGSVRFTPARLVEIVERGLPKDWHTKADPDMVRLLQEEAYADYTVQIAEEDRADACGAVYERVAVWVAERYPVVSA